MTESIDELKGQLRQLQSLQAEGVMSEDAVRSARAALEKRLLEAVMAAPGGSARSASPRPPRALVAKVVLFVAAFGVAGTLWLGNREGWNTAPQTHTQAATSTDDGAGSDHETGAAQIRAMVERLAARMQNEPGNAQGWLMLGRSYAVLGEFEPAIAAYRHVLELEPKNAQALADLADALAVTHEGRLDGEPAALVERALAADGNNLKALLLAGTIAFDKKDYAGAVRWWERAQRAGPADNPLVQHAREGLVEARQLAGLPPLPAEGAGSAPLAGGPAISGRVELAATLAAKVNPDDTVFVFARPAEGSRMPLAILKKRVRDLPLEFKLDDSLAMSPQARLSQAQRVVVGARVSKSGQAMPQAGDLEALSAPVAPGASGLHLVIGEVVR